MGRTCRIAIALSAVLVLSACSGDSRPDGPPEPAPPEVTTPDPEPTPAPDPDPTSGPAASRNPEPVDADDLDLDIAVEAVRHLAGTIGPREATGESYARAADWVARSFTRMGFEVTRQP